MKKLVTLLFILGTLTTRSQTVTGYWYGQANVEMAGIQNNYLTELIISQKGNRVKGFFGYYFKDVYQSFVVKGTYDPKTRKVVISDIPIIYFKTNSTSASVDCITSFYGTLRVSKVKTELNGHFYRDKKYTYTCPDLRVNYTLYTEAKVEDSIFKDMVSTRSFWKPQPPIPDVVNGNNAKQESEMMAVADASDQVKKTDSRPAATASTEKKQTAAAIAAADNKQTNTGTTSAKDNKQPATGTTTAKDNKQAATETTTAKDNKQTATGTTTATDNKVTASAPTSASTEQKVSTLALVQPVMQSDIIKINEDFKKRKQIVSKQILVSSDSVRLSFYDNAEVDGDSISVFLNGKLVIAHQALSERAFNVYVQLDSTREINEVSMFAENLGKYPPNTALMVISDGDKRYETFLSSDFSGNATIRLKLRRNSLAGN